LPLDSFSVSSRSDERRQEMTQLEGCIRFWQSLLKNNRFVMSVSTISQLEATIEFLKELQKIKRLEEK
jgi:hypothetical protein